MNPSPEARQVMREYGWQAQSEKRLRQFRLACWLGAATWLMFVWWVFL